MNASLTHPAPAAHAVGEVPGIERLQGRTHDELFDAPTFAAWYAPGIFTAVMDYIDFCDGAPRPHVAAAARQASEALRTLSTEEVRRASRCYPHFRAPAEQGGIVHLAEVDVFVAVRHGLPLVLCADRLAPRRVGRLTTRRGVDQECRKRRTV